MSRQVYFSQEKWASSRKDREGGAVLLVSLLFLLLLSMLAITTMNSGKLELMMAGNEQARVESYELAQAVVESVIDNWEDDGVTPATLVTDEIICSPGHSDPDSECDEKNIVIDSNLSTEISGSNTEYRTVYRFDGKVPRVSLSRAQQEDVCAFFFDVEASYNNTAARMGSSSIVQGVYLVNPVARCGGKWGDSTDADKAQDAVLPE